MVSERKIKEFERIKNFLEKFRNIIVIDLNKTPNKIYKKVQKELKSKSSILTCVKKRIFKKVVEYLKREDILSILSEFPNMIGIIFTNEDSLKVYKEISAIKVFRYAKEGDVAPKDIWIRAGPTNLPPGPLISELSKVGLVVGVERGKIAVKKDKLLVKKGEKISSDIASVLQKFDIKSIEIKLNIKLAKLNEIWIKKEHLEFSDNLENLLNQAYSNVFNLTINTNYPTNKNLEFILQKAYLNFNIISKLLEK